MTPIRPFSELKLSNQAGIHRFVPLKSRTGPLENRTYWTDFTNQTVLGSLNSEGLYIFNQVIGWIYFLAWTVSFYPQIVLNYQRKSVEGLNFDYITLNIIGFACYTAFNWALYFSDYIFNIYEKEHPGMVYAFYLIYIVYYIP